MEKEKLEKYMVEEVRRRLQLWREYHEHRSNSTPGTAYSNADIVADRVYESRRLSTFTNSNPQPKLNLDFSDEAILSMLQNRKTKSKSEY